MNTKTESTTSVETDDQISIRVLWAQRGYILFASLFVLGILGQVFIAGMAVFVDPAHWNLHASFVHYIQLLAIIMLVLAILGGLSRWLMLSPIVLFLLIVLQYATALGFSGSVVAALHPVNALVIFGLASLTTYKAWRTTADSPPAS
ncbi:DUF6220 domain-containing protein [Haladaptatus pallidirubidus]|uniref:Uncharacterized protein n=2 Tax=Haladaptatus pallidirubidus TaxID=1008152 RepID=A0AAV3UQE3_9EURY|nr:DUF6220 domain-containing protein [Haladaptatus pallidirubidus]